MLLLDHNSIRSLSWMLKLLHSHLGFYQKLIFLADNSKILIESFKNSDRILVQKVVPLYFHFFILLIFLICPTFLQKLKMKAKV